MGEVISGGKPPWRMQKKRKKSEPGELSAKERVDGGAGREENIREREIEQTALGPEGLFDANTGVKREGLRCRPARIFQG